MTVATLAVTTHRLRLAPWAPDGAPALRRLLVDPSVRRYLGGPVDAEEVDDRLDHEVGGGHPGSFAVHDRLSMSPVGWVAADALGTDVEISWQLLPEHVGRGLAFEAGRALLELAFTDTDAVRVVADTQEANTRSRRLAERLGMRLEGRFVQFGEPQVRYVVTRSEVQHRVDPADTLDRVRRWAAGSDAVLAVGLVGSWARGAGGPGSDVDLVAVLDRVDRLIDSDRWLAEIAPWRWWRDEPWGLVTSRRVGHDGGLQVEYGITDRRWVTPPIDPGTSRVIDEGLRPLHDPDGLLARAAAWVAAHG